MKKGMKIYICIILIMSTISISMASCSNAVKEDENINNSSIAMMVQSELTERGVSFGMTEEEVKSIEKDITFVIDPNLTMVDTENTLKTICSETPVKYAGHDAIISYAFFNDYLYELSYDIDVNYTSSELTSNPTYALFLDFTLKYTDILGNPQISEIDTDSSLSTWYTNMWHDGDVDSPEDTYNYVISIFASQSKYRSYADDYSDTVNLSFYSSVKGQ